ncbi:MAG: cysteine desulfurase NifS [Deltaproteobacteria bacterium]|nr:cysteine desulfurase NifS [Deltaproteobacteria bacterium]
MIYLDNNATTPVLPQVLETMLPFLTELWGNPSSLHQFGAQVAKHLDTAREQTAELLHAQRAHEIIFTSGGTESNNLALRGVLQAQPEKKHLVTTAVEHPSILMVCEQLEKEGYTVTRLGVDKSGALDLKELDNALTPDTALTSIMWANNETGVLFPIETISKICQAKNILLHVDATQAVGKVDIDVRKAAVDLLSLSGHKLHAPKGIGALYVKRGTKMSPLTFGGGQERGRRAGTENVPSIIALGKAAALAKERLENGDIKKLEELRNNFERTLLEKFDEIKINGATSKRLPNTSNISFEGCDGETICLLLSEVGIAVSTGSACSVGSLEPSHVLKAMGLNHKQAKGAVRFSMSCETTTDEIKKTTDALEKIISRLKKP